MPSLGLSYDIVREINPGLVMTSISNFGQTGPYRDYKAEEIEMYALSGLMYETGDPAKSPLVSGPSLTQYSAGMSAYTGTLTALFHRGVMGRGQHVEVSMQESALINIEMSLVECLQLGKVRKRTNDRHSMVPWELYECEDGEVAVISGPMRHWRRAAEIFDDARLFDEKYDHCLDRREFREEYEAFLKPCIKKYKKKELFYAGQERKLAFGYLASLDEALESPQHQSREFFVEIDHPTVGKHKYCGTPFKMSETPCRSARAPLLGEHNQTIYHEILKFSKEEIQQLQHEGVI
jgi:crotonobetainyl-CoA:carnitine CoA-transferase CaiB-like acyl-CoA transferase